MRIFLPIPLSLLLLVSVCSAEILEVPTEFPTIQAAIDASSPGDSVLVHPGIYFENISVQKSITIISSDGPESTIIDGGQSGHVVCMGAGSAVNTRLQGFTIRNGSAFDGAGIYCNCNAIIQDNIIEYNETLSEGHGAGIFVRSDIDLLSLTIEENVFRNNIVHGDYGSEPPGGGGIYLQFMVDAMVLNNDFHNNEAKNGAAIHCKAASYVSIVRNELRENTAYGAGGGIYCDSCADLLIANNFIHDNTNYRLGSAGGGISIERSGKASISNNLIVSNTCPDTNSYGGGIMCRYTPVQLNNNTIHNNQVNHYGGGIYIDLDMDQSATILDSIYWNNFADIGPQISLAGKGILNISNSDVMGGQGSVWVDSSSFLNWGSGMIDADPMFLSGPKGIDYLDETSPCVDAGHDLAENIIVDAGTGTIKMSSMTVETDHDPDIGLVDMGHHYIRELYVPGDYGTIQSAIDNVPDYVEIVVRPGTYHEHIDFLSKTLTLTAEKGPDSTVIDGGGTGSVVSLIQNNSMIEGFSIINGENGIHCSGFSPTVRNCIIAGNTSFVDGAGILCEATNALLQNNLILTNAAAGEGGGICCIASNAAIVNNTVYDNTATNGGGICCRNSTPTITNNILWNNTATAGTDEISVDGGSNPVVTFSDIEGGWPGEGNIGGDLANHDPLFDDPQNADFGLGKESPCINRGTNSCSGEKDMYGTPLPYMGTVEMGCIEFSETHILGANRFSMTTTQGGLVIFTIDAGREHCKRGYLLLGSLSGSTPGTYLPGGGGILRLQWDWLTSFIQSHVNYPMFMNFSGFLDGDGKGLAVFNTGGPLPPFLNGETITFACTLVGPYEYPSNPIELQLE